MSEQLRPLVAFDGSRNGYLPIIQEAADNKGWRVLPFDEEAYALEELGEHQDPALVVVPLLLPHARTSFEGRSLLKQASAADIPYALIAEEELAPKLKIDAPNLFIPRVPGEITQPLADWLTKLQDWELLRRGLFL